MHGSSSKIPSKHLVSQRCAEGFNSGVKGLIYCIYQEVKLAKTGNCQQKQCFSGYWTAVERKLLSRLLFGPEKVNHIDRFRNLLLTLTAVTSINSLMRAVRFTHPVHPHSTTVQSKM
jgi:hypothetical protein